MNFPFLCLTLVPIMPHLSMCLPWILFILYCPLNDCQLDMTWRRNLKGEWACLSGIYLADNWSGIAWSTMGTPILGRWEQWLHEKCSWTRASEARQSSVFLSHSTLLPDFPSTELWPDLFAWSNKPFPAQFGLNSVLSEQQRENQISMTIHITVFHKTMLESHREVEPGVMYTFDKWQNVICSYYIYVFWLPGHFVISYIWPCK